MFLNDRLNFFPERLYAFWTDKYREGIAWFSVHDLLSQQLVKGECEGLHGKGELGG